MQTARYSWPLAALGSLFLLSTAAWGQMQAGRIVGQLTDPSGAVIPGANIVVTEVATNVTHTAQASSNGTFVVTPLGPGGYTASAAAEGFRTVTKTGITLQVGQIARVDFQLEIGDVTTTIEVGAELPLTDTESGALGQVIDNEKIVDLPLNGRSFYELARLTTGAAVLPATGAVANRIRPSSISGLTISGVAGNQISFFSDGMDVSDNLGGTIIQTSIDAIQEFKVQQNAYSAEFSGAGGAFNLTTKSGSNRIHGSLFEFLRNDKLDSRDFFAPRRQILRRNQFGGTVGGPIVRNKTFFFVTYDATRERLGNVYNNLVPSAAMRNGDFSEAGAGQIYDPLTTVGSGASASRSLFPNNVIPAARRSSQSAFFNDYIPLPNSPSGTAVFSPTQALDLYQVTTRVDHSLGDKHRIFGRYSIHDNALNDPHPFPALGVAPLKTRGQNAAFSITSVLTPSVIHEARFSYILGTLDNTPFLVDQDFNAMAGITGFEDTRRPDIAGSFPDFSWSGFTAMNGSAFDQRPKTQDRETFDYMDNLTWIKGSHVFKFGGRFRRLESLFSDARQYVGLWSFTGINTENPVRATGTGNSFADWALGAPRSGQRAFYTEDFGGSVNFWHFFAQDDFKVNQRLTLNLGLRYEYSPWVKGYRGQLGTFDPTRERSVIIASETDQIDLDAQPAAKFAFPLFEDIIQTSSQAGLPLQITANDTNQWAPRFGFAFRPFGDGTVIRAGYGMFYEAEVSSTRTNITMVPFKLDEIVFNDRGVADMRLLDNFFRGERLGSASTAPTINPASLEQRAAYDQHWNFGIQQAVTKTTLFEANYVGNKGSFLAGTNDFNLPVAGPGNVQARRPYQRFSRSQYRTGDSASSYHSLQAKLERRLQSGYWYLVSYTFSKSLYHSQNSSVGGGTAWEKALWTSDIPHNLSVGAGYELPFGRGRKYLSSAGGVVDALLGGWQMQGILGIRSGRPFTPNISRDVANIGVSGQRPIRVGDGSLDNPTVQEWFDRSAFILPENFTYGNSGGNILREDSLETLDFSIMKRFRVTEGSSLQFRAEAFNMTNTPSFLAPSGVVDVATGARVTSTSVRPRQVQLALKFLF